MTVEEDADDVTSQTQQTTATINQPTWRSSATTLSTSNSFNQPTTAENTHKYTSTMDKITDFFSRREVLATLTMVPIIYFYWEALVESLDGSTFKAVLIVAFFWMGIAIDVSQHMTGQPGGHDHHHHHD